jgi:integrase/recombinase XerD
VAAGIGFANLNVVSRVLRLKQAVPKAAILSSAQARDVLASARRHGRHSNRAEVALTLSIELGLRAIELAALTFGDVYGPEGGVRPAISIKPAYMATVEVSIVDIESTKLRGLLADYREKEFGGHGAADCIPLFRSQRGGALTAASMARFITGLYHRAGISNGSSRSGRRTLLDRQNHRG